MQCEAKTLIGTKCKMPAIMGGDLCYIHSPETAADRAASRKLGGKNRYTPHFADPDMVPANVGSLDDARGLLSYILGETLGMDNSIARARVLIALFDSYVKSFEIGEIEARLQALEQQRK